MRSQLTNQRPPMLLFPHEYSWESAIKRCLKSGSGILDLEVRGSTWVTLMRRDLTFAQFATSLLSNLLIYMSTYKEYMRKWSTPAEPARRPLAVHHTETSMKRSVKATSTPAENVVKSLQSWSSWILIGMYNDWNAWIMLSLFIFYALLL